MPDYLKFYLIYLVIFLAGTFLLKTVGIPLFYKDNSPGFRNLLALFGVACLTLVIWTCVVLIMLVCSL